MLDRRAALVILMLIPMIFAQGDKCVTWAELPRLFAALGFISTFISNMVTLNVIGAVIGGIIAAVLNYVLVLIAIKITGH